jgi:hypothetical protein
VLSAPALAARVYTTGIDGVAAAAAKAGRGRGAVTGMTVMGLVSSSDQTRRCITSERSVSIRLGRAWSAPRSGVQAEVVSGVGSGERGVRVVKVVWGLREAE